MKFKLKYLAAGTLACLTTVSTATHSATFGFQSDQPSLQSLLQSPPRTNSLLPRPVTAVEGVIQQVGFTTQETGSPNRLVPLPPAPIQGGSPTSATGAATGATANAAGPLVPIRGGSSSATALPAPIISAPARTTTPAIDSPAGIPTQPVPIVTRSTRLDLELAVAGATGVASAAGDRSVPRDKSVPAENGGRGLAGVSAAEK